MNFKNRKSPRLATWDYGSSASYFITICTKNREHFFGKILNQKMQLTPAGAIAAVFWHEIKNHAKNIELGEFVVMPNHIHGILILKRDESIDVSVGTTQNDVRKTDNDVGATQNDGLVGATHALPLLPSSSRFQNQGKNTVSSIVGSYKSAVTKYCNLLNLPMGWQSRFHDHIIRDEDSFHRISQYIRNNPSKWNEDLFY